MTNKSLTDYVADHIENPKKAEADDLREAGFGRYVLNRTISRPLAIIAGLGITVGVAALAGEAMDHVPYISTAVPEAIKGLTNSEYFYGNLDKLGAALGFIGHYLKRE